MDLFVQGKEVIKSSTPARRATGTAGPLAGDVTNGTLEVRSNGRRANFSASRSGRPASTVQVLRDSSAPRIIRFMPDDRFKALRDALKVSPDTCRSASTSPRACSAPDGAKRPSKIP